MRTGTAYLPLHYGKAPRWLFSRMTGLAREITRAIVGELGAEELLGRLSDPYWFQAFGCLLGFDWHSSGLTTTLCGALKEGLRDLGGELGVFVAGGKGKTSRQTPEEIDRIGERFALEIDANKLIYASRLAAKVDSAAVQDGYQIYHHTFVFTQKGSWAVIQQGMNETNRYARRYHWLSDQVTDFVCEPHSAIITDSTTPLPTLNMVASEGEECRTASAALARERPELIVRELTRIKELRLPPYHQLLIQDLNPLYLERIFTRTYEHQPETFEQLLGTPGVGPMTIRALALTADLIYGSQASFRDPAEYSFAHGGKDGHPYPVNRHCYDESIHFLEEAVSRAKLGYRDKLDALKRLSAYLDTKEEPLEP